MFKNGEIITLANKQKVKVINLLGQGGQGAVYEVESNGKKYALKWYLPEYLKQINQKAFYENLSDNFKAGAPASDFLWPLAISAYKENSFGYLMELRPKQYVGFSSLLNAKSKFTSFKSLLNAAKKICIAFQKLHMKGYSYQDINDGNVFVDTKTGDILICDNDNVAPYGTWLGIIGKDRYMAPEVVLGNNHPSMETDLYSLAVILFMLIFVAHPLEGAAVHACPCLTTKYIKKFYAEDAVFVYDPNKGNNRPVKGIDNNVIIFWKYYPEFLRDIFIKAFTDGLYKPSHRIRENEWIDCFEKMEDIIITCPYCGNEEFYNYTQNDNKFVTCGDCGRKYAKPFVLVGKHINKPIIKGSIILGRHINIQGCDVFGEVVESKKHEGLLGIKNYSDLEIHVDLPNGKEMTVTTDQVIPLFDGTKMTVDNQEIKIIF